jgi:hypothetical protein
VLGSSTGKGGKNRRETTYYVRIPDPSRAKEFRELNANLGDELLCELSHIRRRSEVYPLLEGEEESLVGNLAPKGRLKLTGGQHNFTVHHIACVYLGEIIGPFGRPMVMIREKGRDFFTDYSLTIPEHLLERLHEEGVRHGSELLFGVSNVHPAGVKARNKRHDMVGSGQSFYRMGCELKDIRDKPRRKPMVVSIIEEPNPGAPDRGPREDDDDYEVELYFELPDSMKDEAESLDFITLQTPDLTLVSGKPEAEATAEIVGYPDRADGRTFVEETSRFFSEAVPKGPGPVSLRWKALVEEIHGELEKELNRLKQEARLLGVRAEPFTDDWEVGDDIPGEVQELGCDMEHALEDACPVDKMILRLDQIGLDLDATSARLRELKRKLPETVALDLSDEERAALTDATPKVLTFEETVKVSPDAFIASFYDVPQEKHQEEPKEEHQEEPKDEVQDEPKDEVQDELPEEKVAEDVPDGGNACQDGKICQCGERCQDGEHCQEDGETVQDEDPDEPWWVKVARYQAGLEGSTPIGRDCLDGHEGRVVEDLPEDRLEEPMEELPDDEPDLLLPEDSQEELQKELRDNYEDDLQELIREDLLDHPQGDPKPKDGEDLKTETPEEDEGGFRFRP